MKIPDTYPTEWFDEGNEVLAPGAQPVGGDRYARETDRLLAPKLLFLVAAGVSLVGSVFLWFAVDREQGLFVGLWVPSILSLGSLLLSDQRGRK